MSQPLILSSSRVVFPDGERPATLVIKDGHLASIEPYRSNNVTRDCGDLAILPGVIDPHVHFNEPGRTEWEGWQTGTQAAIAGGVTTVVEMPLNSIPSTVDLSSLNEKQESMKGKLACDVGLWGGAVPGNSEDLKILVDSGALGLKCFLSDPGTAEFSNLNRDELRLAMTRIAAIDSVLLIHAEWPDGLKPVNPATDPETYEAWLETRPLEAERLAIAEVVKLSEETGCRCHIVHVSSADLLDVLEGSSVTCETCAHYLVFCAEEIADRATNFKCAPPIRAKSHQEGLWQALKDGRISMVTSDHSPCPPDLKNDSFVESWGGIAGVQMLLSAVWTGASQRNVSLSEVAGWLSEAPSRLAGLHQRTGTIEVGKEANLVVFDPEAEFLCESLYHRHAGSPYEGRQWKGVVQATYLRGVQVFSKGEPPLIRGSYLGATL